MVIFLQIANTDSNIHQHKGYHSKALQHQYDRTNFTLCSIRIFGLTNVCTNDLIRWPRQQSAL